MPSRKVGLFGSMVLVPATAWLLRRVRRDYEEWGRLSREVSAVGWVLYLLHAALTLTAALHPSVSFGRKSARVVGGVLSLSGFSLLASGMREFRSFEKISGLESGNLVKTGPYRFSRNPQVTGGVLGFLGVALAGRSAEALLLVAFYCLVHGVYFVSEEKHLERTFGEEYRRYRQDTPRLLGFPG